MKATVLGRVIGTVAGILLAIGFVVGSLGPAIAAIVLLAMLDAASRGSRAGKITAARALPPIVGMQRPFETSLHVQSEEPVPLWVEDIDPPVEEVRRRGGSGRGEVLLRRSLQAHAPGRLEWKDIRVHSGDRWGLWYQEHLVPAPGQTRVSPDGTHLESGRRAGRRFTVQASAKDALAAEPLAEVRQLREYMPADRARDIDWRLTATMGTMHVRERERAAPRRYVVFMDATRSMRRAGRTPKLRSAVNTAIGLAGAAQGAGVSASLVAFHEQGVYKIGNATSRAAMQEIAQGLSGLPSVEGVEGFRLTTDLDRQVTQAEIRFLRTVAPLSAAPLPTAPSLDSALAALDRSAGGQAFVVAIMDGEVHPRRAEVAVRRLKRMGHSVVLVVPATGAHHCTKQDAPLDDLQEAMARRERLGRLMATMKVPMFILYPDDEDGLVREVAACAV